MVGQNSQTASFDWITRVDGPRLGLEFKMLGGGGSSIIDMAVDDLVIECLNYGAQAQDYHFWDARGMVNARYDGCKLTSTDYNIDSEDTVDGGPVITVTVGGGDVLSVQPTKQKGNFEIL